MDWGSVSNVLETLAPTIATALGTPVLGGAVAALEAVFGLTPKQSDSMDDRQAAITNAVCGATPEQLQAVRKADQDYAARMAEAGFKDREALAALQVQEQSLYIGDTADARKANAGNDRVFVLGCVVLSTFGVVMIASLWGAWDLMTGKLPQLDAAVIGMVSGFVGTVIGYVSANAQQVVSYFFGSSKGGEDKSTAMADAFKTTFGNGGPARK